MLDWPDCPPSALVRQIGSKDFLEAGKKRLAGDTARAATSDEVKELRRETSALKEVVAELTLENR
jgi:transposase